MLAAQNFVADLNDQFVALAVELLPGMVGIGCGFLQDGVGARSSRAASDPGRC